MISCKFYFNKFECLGRALNVLTHDIDNINTRDTNPPPPATMDRVAGGGLTSPEFPKTNPRTLAWLNSHEERKNGTSFGPSSPLHRV